MKNRGGFTIIETIIVFSISSVLFFVMMAMFSGKQGRVEFAQGLRDIESHIQDVANDVRNGYYPNVPNQVCDSDINGITFTESLGGLTISQGTSTKCIFAGKVMFINGQSAPSAITSYSLAGLKSAETLANLKLKLIGITGAETADEYKMPSGISLISGSLNKTSALIGLIFNVEGVNVLETGSKKISNVEPYIFSVSGNSIDDIKNSLNLAFANIGNSASLIGSGGVKLCFLSGTSNQKGIITLKKGPDGLSTSLLIDQVVNGTTGCSGN